MASTSVKGTNVDFAVVRPAEAWQILLMNVCEPLGQSSSHGSPSLTDITRHRKGQAHRRLPGDRKKFAYTTRSGQGISQEGSGRMFSSRFTYHDVAVEYFDSSSIGAYIERPRHTVSDESVREACLKTVMLRHGVVNQPLEIKSKGVWQARTCVSLSHIAEDWLTSLKRPRARGI
jgi:hypothetical protein